MLNSCLDRPPATRPFSENIHAPFLYCPRIFRSDNDDCKPRATHSRRAERALQDRQAFHRFWLLEPGESCKSAPSSTCTSRGCSTRKTRRDDCRTEPAATKSRPGLSLVRPQIHM